MGSQLPRDAGMSGWKSYQKRGCVFGSGEIHLGCPGTGSGFIWRLFSISRFEERDGGVYVELEAMALSRCVPAGLWWLVNPVVSRLSQSSLVTFLSQTREAVRSLRQRKPAC
jgi:hypothetical protein